MSWQEVSLNEFLINRQDRFKPNDTRIKNLKRIDKIDFSGQIFLSEKSSKTDMILVKKGDLVISGINVEKGAMSVYEGQEDVTATIHYSSYHFNNNKINIDFLKLFLKSIEFKNAIKEQVPGGIKTEIKPKHLLPLKIIIPKSTIEQAQIVKNFDLVNKNISKVSDELTHQTEILNKLRQQILQDAIQGKLVPQDPKDEPASVLLDKIIKEKNRLVKQKKLKLGKTTNQSNTIVDIHSTPKSWIWCKSDEVFFVTKLAGFEYTEYFSLKVVGEIPVIRAQNVRQLEIDKSNILYIDKKTSYQLERCALTKKCLLLTFIGAGIGDVATFNENERWHLAPNVAKMEPFEDCDELVDLKFINYYLISKIGQDEIFKHVKATAQPSLSMGTIRDIDLPLPPINEQHRIVKKLDQLTQIFNELEDGIKQNQNLSQQLLQSALKEALEPKG